MEITKEQLDKIMELYYKEKTVTEISEQLSIPWKDVFEIIRIQHTMRRYTDFTEEAQKRIVKMYTEDKMTANQIGKEFVISHHSIAHVLDRNGIPRSSKTGKRIYAINETYFDKIDTPNKAYILGFFYADGCNNKKKFTVSMSLQEEDQEILEKIRLEIGSERPLEYIDYSNKHDGGYHYKNQYRLLLFNSHMCDVLEQHGMVPRKSLVLTFPEFLPTELHSHFIRGYMDGDGCIVKSNTHNITYSANLLSTNEFCQKVKEIVKKEVGINSSIYDAPNKNGISKYLVVAGRNNTKKFLDYIYTDAELYMERKFQRYQELYCNSDSLIA